MSLLWTLILKINKKFIYYHVIWYYIVIYVVKIQIDLSKEEDKIVEVYKLMNDLKTKQEAIKQMIHYFSVDIKPKTLKEKEYFK